MAKRGRKKKKVGGKSAANRVDGRSQAGRLASLSTEALAAELERRQKHAREALVQERSTLATRLAVIDAELASLGIKPPARVGGGGGAAKPAKVGKSGKRRGRPPGSKNKVKTSARVGGKPATAAAAPSASSASSAPRGKRRRGRRPKNTMSLVEALHKTLAGKVMSVVEIVPAVQADGYKTTSANFRTIVNQTLISNPDKFRKVARGQYTSKD